MKIVSKCGEVQIDLNLHNTEVTMQVELMPEWIRGKHTTGIPCCCRNAFGLYSFVRPELRTYGVYLWGDAVDADSRVASCFYETVKKAAHYCQQVQDLIESFDSTKLIHKRSETITSKCGRVKVQLDLDGTIVSMQVLAMPDELRGHHGFLNPMHVAHGLELHSHIDPTLYGLSVYLRGTMPECDDNVAKKRYSSLSGAIDYYTRVKALIEGFDSEDMHEAVKARCSETATVSQRLDALDDRMQRVERWFYGGVGKRIEVE